VKRQVQKVEAEAEVRQYEVKLPFRSVNDNKLVPPIDLAEGLRIEESDGDYLANAAFDVPSAEIALSHAEHMLNDLLGLLAVSGGAFVILQGDSRRNVRRLNAPYVAEGPPPPFETIGGVITAHGAELYDPTGEFRRAGRIANMSIRAEVTRRNIEFERRAFEHRAAWDERLATAIALFHQTECASDPSVAFILCYTTLEVLSEDTDSTLLKAIMPAKNRREEFAIQLRAYFAGLGFEPAHVERFVGQVQRTRMESQLDVFQRYLARWGCLLDISELGWYRDQRGRYVHAGGFDVTEDAKRRMDNFKQEIRKVLKQEIERISPVE
jgi:hypothetical protein